MTERRTKVLIFGCLQPADFPLEEEAQRHLDDEDWEVWCMNASMLPWRWDAWFQLHSFQHMLEAHGQRYINELRTVAAYYPKLVYIFDKWAHEFPGANVFPHLSIVQSFGDYFTGSYAWLLAFARLLRVRQVYIAAGSMIGAEWARPCIEYHAGMCIRDGMTVEADKASGLFDRRGGLYGYDPLRHLGGYDCPGDELPQTVNTINGVREVE